MRDIGERLHRRRLLRYAPPDSPARRGFRWVAVVLVSWLVWAGLISDHSFYRIWRLSRENRRVSLEVEQLTSELQRLEAEARDPRARRERAEHALREKTGMAKPGEIIYRIRGGEDSSSTLRD